MPLPLAFFLSLLLCLVNVLPNHAGSTAGILPTPLVIIALTGLLNWQQHHVVASTASTALLICLHDASLRFYGGSAHDMEAGGVMTVLLLMGLLPAYTLLLGILRQATNTASRGNRALAALVLPMIMGAYLVGLSVI